MTTKLPRPFPQLGRHFIFPFLYRLVGPSRYGYERIDGGDGYDRIDRDWTPLNEIVQVDDAARVFFIHSLVERQ